MPVQDAGLLAAEIEARRRDPRSALARAVWSLAAGQPAAGLDDLRGALDERGRGIAAAYRPEIAAVLGDWQAAADEARAALPDAARSVSGWREFRSAILALLADEEPVAEAAAAALDAVAATGDRLRSGQPSAVAEIPRGLLTRDTATLARGLDALLRWHLRRARARSETFNSERAVISLDAIGALLLADRRALRVPVAPAYRQAAVPLLVIHLQEWKGEPLPRAMPVQLVTDLIAGAWLRGRGLAGGVDAQNATEG